MTDMVEARRALEAALLKAAGDAVWYRTPLCDRVRVLHFGAFQPGRGSLAQLGRQRALVAEAFDRCVAQGDLVAVSDRTWRAAP